MKHIIFTITFILVFCFGFSQGHQTITVNEGVATCDIIPFYETPYVRISTDPIIQIMYNRDSISDMCGCVLRGIAFYTTTAKAQAVIDVIVKETGRKKAGGMFSGGITVFRGLVNIKSGRIDIPFSKIYKYKGGNLVIKIMITQSDRIACKGATITTKKQTFIVGPGLWDYVTFSPKTSFVYWKGE